MKIAFISNFLNHHQLPFCLEMYNKANIQYYFIATEEIPQERLNLGYENMNEKYPFVIETYKSKAKDMEAIKIINESDVVIIGSAPERYIKARLKQNKLTFRYSERIFKKGIWRFANLKTILSMIIHNTVYRNKKMYMLCASAYTSYDFSLVFAYKNKCYKWGYFPETKKYDIEKLLARKSKNHPIKLLWVARFIDWKHPELVVELAKRIKQEGIEFKIQMIGCGEMFEQIKENIKKEKLDKEIELIGAVKASKVREYMENANIFLATSDQNEGWGAVINEAMNSACVVVGNKKIGAIPYLISDGKNGLTYSDFEEFFEKVKYIIHNETMRNTISKNAYNSIINTWNAENATNNFIKLCESLINNLNVEIKEGPCSKDKIRKK